MPNIRISLLNTIEARSSDATKDSIIVNGFVEMESKELLYVVKRPGRIQKIVGTGAAQGVFVYGLNVYNFDAGKTATTPTITLLSSL